MLLRMSRLAVEDGQRAGGAAAGNGDHDSVGELAGRDGPVGEGVLGELVVVVRSAVAGGEADACDSDQEAAEYLGTERLGKETSILQR